MNGALRVARQCVATDVLLGLSEVPIRAKCEKSAEFSEPLEFTESGKPAELTGSPRVERAVAGERDGAGTARIVGPAHGESIALSREERVVALELLRDRHARECPHCTTATAHTNLVFGEGDPEARLMFVGEAPGETEDQLGRPFVGKAGQKLDEMIEAMEFRRADVYVANVLKSRPPGNRTPLQHEVAACGPFLVEQIRIVRPEVIVTLGGPATKLILGSEFGITRLRGIWSEFLDGVTAIPVMPTFHPAYLLRNYTPETRREIWSDLKAVLARLDPATRGVGRTP